MNRLLQYSHTIKYLKLSQILWRLWISVHKRLYRCKSYPDIKFNNNLHLKASEFTSDNKNSINIFGTNVEPMAVDWNSSGNTKLWCYHLHYFDYLAAFDRDPGIDLINSWIQNNPVGMGAGWEPYPISLRTVNWIKFIIQHRIQADSDIIRSLQTQMYYLYAFREKHLLANHYFKNLVAILYLGYFLGNNKLIKWSVNEIKVQIKEQSVHGLHYEFSPTYHALFTKDLIDIYNLLKSNNLEIELQEKVNPVIINALNWAYYLFRYGGYVSAGDVNYEGCPGYDELIKQYESISGDVFETQTVNQLDYFPVMEHMDFEIMLLNAPFNPSYNPAHSHCDKLSVLLWYDGIPILVDTGNFSYEKSEERDFARSVEAHNTLQIDKLQQAECWDVFRIGRRGKVSDTKIFSDKMQATYQYKNYYHNRYISKIDNGILITDNIECHGPHNYRLYFHINPDLNFILENNIVNFNKLDVAIKFPDAKVTSIETDYYPGMYIKRRKATIIAEGTFCDRITLETIISR